MIQEAHGFDVWKNPYTPQGWPSLVDLRADPFERAPHESIGWPKWAAERMFAFVPAQAYVAQFLETFKEFPPRMRAASFSIDQVMEKLQESGQSH